jgi:class 3 adenylate cyclase
VCGQENPEGFRFCGACASPLATGEVGQREQRKVVTALFCDLVGFTSLSETADPEDVNTMLDAYSAMARSQIENHGGIVQKFIGDAVVGVFGPARAGDGSKFLTGRVCPLVASGTALGDNAARGADGDPVRAEWRSRDRLPGRR